MEFFSWTSLDIQTLSHRFANNIESIFTTLYLKLLPDVQTLDIKTLAGFKNIEHRNFYWMYEHWILKLDIQTLDIKTLIGYTNIRYQNFSWIYKHWISKL